MARKIVRLSYTIDKPTFNFDMMLPIWQRFSTGNSNQPYTWASPSNAQPVLNTELDPDRETLIIINITVTADAYVGGGYFNTGYTGWDPLRNCYRAASNVNDQSYPNPLPGDTETDYHWNGPSDSDYNLVGRTYFYPKGYGATDSQSSPLLLTRQAQNNNNWNITFPTVTKPSANTLVESLVTVSARPGLNHLASTAAMHIGVPPSNKWQVQINIKNNGIICGSGGTGGTGITDAMLLNVATDDRVVGREGNAEVYDGLPGHDAIDARVGKDPSKTYPTNWVRVNVINVGSGQVLAGGGGGGGGGGSMARNELNQFIRSGMGGGGSAGAGLNVYLFDTYWYGYEVTYPQIIDDTLGAGSEIAINYNKLSNFTLGGYKGRGGRSDYSYYFNDSNRGNYNGSPGSLGKDPVTNLLSTSLGGQGGAKGTGPGHHQFWSDINYTPNLSNTWAVGGYQGGDGGNGGDYGQSGQAGSEPSGRTIASELANSDQVYYGTPGRGGQAGRAAIYSDNASINIRSARPRNVKGSRLKIDPV